LFWPRPYELPERPSVVCLRQNGALSGGSLR